ncbi:hypothetical protein Trydic_g13657 [Trypoxylus dichotomus]
MTLPVSSNRAKRIANRASEALVRGRINYRRLAKIRITQECEIKQKIGEIVNEEDFTNICAAVQRSCSRINGQVKDKQRRKLKSLIRQKESNSVDSRKAVINLSSKQLDDNAIKILNKGMKFAIAPTRIPTLDMILAVEMAAGKIQPPEAVDEYRWKIRTAVERAKPKQIRQNISKAERSSLKELMSDKNIKILPADKGNATVIMDAGTYNIKIQEIINEEKYNELKKDPTASVESKIQQTLKKYKSDLPNQLSW